MMKRVLVCVAAMGIAGGMALSAQAETLVWNGAADSCSCFCPLRSRRIH